MTRSSVDPVIDTNLPQQNTGYTYAGNNPTTYTDPTGLRLDEGCGWATTCKAAIAKGATGTPRPTSQADYTTVSKYTYGLLKGWKGSADWRNVKKMIDTASARTVNAVSNEGVKMASERSIPAGVGATLWMAGCYGFIHFCSTAVNATLALQSLFKSGGIWDAKPYVYRKYGYSAASAINNMVYDSESGNWVRVDVFGNVSYGIMMHDLGISESTALHASQAKLDTVGVTDETDNIAISLGYEMAEKNPYGISEDVYRQQIIERLGTEW